uniref:Uncharacterized protein n=1 Tax=Romanomermis culicivorax TaxID=13658 RepID=A0A915IQB2_ROMCU
MSGIPALNSNERHFVSNAGIPKGY